MAATRDVEVSGEKIDAMTAILDYGIMFTPGVASDAQVAHAGRAPDRKKVEGGLA